MKMISRKMIFFVFDCIPKNTFKNILQYCVKDKAEREEGEACIFRKWFTKKLDVNHFPNFIKGFSDQ